MSSVALTATVVVSQLLPSFPVSLFMFGFMAVIFSMKERVESSTEMVRWGGGGGEGGPGGGKSSTEMVRWCEGACSKTAKSVGIADVPGSWSLYI